MNTCCRAAIHELRTGSQVAEELGVHRTYVWQLASKHGLGIDVAGVYLVYTPADIETMRGKIRQPKP